MATKTVLETLEAARALISDPAEWTQGEDARNAAGVKVEADSPDAVCFCGSGALFAVNRDFYVSAIYSLRLAIGGSWFSDFNDAPERTHKEVLAAFDAAIAKEKAEVTV